MNQFFGEQITEQGTAPNEMQLNEQQGEDELLNGDIRLQLQQEQMKQQMLQQQQGGQ